MNRSGVVILLCAGCVGCTRTDQQRAKQDLHKSGEAVKSELKKDANFMKQQLEQARKEAETGAKEIKQKIGEKKADYQREHRDTH